MMRALFSAAPNERARILRERKDIAVSIHEAGHALMGSAHNLLEWVELPSYDASIDCLGGNAHTVLTNSNKRIDILADLCLSGYCAELCFLEAPNLHDCQDDFYFNDTAAYGDFVSFLASTRLHDEVLHALLNGTNNIDIKIIMKMIFNKYGERTYKFLSNRREILIVLSGNIYQTWRASNFRSIIWTM